MKIYSKDISDKKEFTFDGERLKLNRCLDEESHIYLFERYNSAGMLYAYELVRGIRHKNPDGQIVYVYPSSEQFGRYGFFIAKNHLEESLTRFVQKLTPKEDA